jgi:phospholipase/lecithinase/hemolysin
MGNGTVLDGAVVIATAQAYASTPANIGAAMAADQTLTTPAAAGAKLFVQSLTTQLVADVPAAQKAAAAAAIPTAFSTTYVAALTAGSSTADAQNAAVGAALQAAADGGNAKVSAILGTSNHSTLGAVGNASLAANQFALAWAAANGQADIGPMVVQAANDLVAIVKDLVNNKKATRVVVLNLPDMSLTPSAMGESAGTQQLILGLVQAFNGTLQAGLNATPGVPSNGVLFLDYFTDMQRLVNDPGHYALAIDPVTQKALRTPVCKESVPLNIGLSAGSSLMCNANTAGHTVTGDTSHYMFADGVHPTPFAHKLASQFVNKIMIQAGWL